MSMTDVAWYLSSDRYVSVQDPHLNLKLARLPIPPHPRVDSSDETH